MQVFLDFYLVANPIWIIVVATNLDWIIVAVRATGARLPLATHDPDRPPEPDPTPWIL